MISIFWYLLPFSRKGAKMGKNGGKSGGDAGTKSGDKNRAFSRRFDAALAETRMIDVMVKADGWSLAEFANAPLWLRDLYTRHAEAACGEAGTGGN
jgi:hypothetical protein